MNPPAHSRSLLGALLVAPLVTVLGCLALVAVPAGPAHAAARVSIAGLDGGARAEVDGPTTLRLGGSGFQSVKNGFGGIYVLFGWVSDPSGGAWRPSNGGVTGEDLRYVPDSETADNAGMQRFVAFPGSSTEDEANGGVVAADGSWSTQLVVPGAVFTTVDRSGASVEVDCTQVQCGVITIGAHGVKNGANETFTPVSFGTGQASSDDAGSDGGNDGGDGGGDDAAAGASGGATAGGTAAGATDGASGDVSAADGADGAKKKAALPDETTVGIDKTTAVAGRVLSFTGQGFEPGEQVVATMDGGVLAVGPLTAGTYGDVAGLLELPGDLRLGTHALKVTGASSGRAPEVEVIVTRDPAEAEAADALLASASGAGGAGSSSGALAYSPAELAAGGALLVLLLVVVSSAVAGARRRRAARAEAPAGPASDGAAPTNDAPTNDAATNDAPTADTAGGADA